jgi:NAD-dependent deacetylase sirtuin 4
MHEWLVTKKNILCLTGAGISTSSGIPDYRGHDGSYQKGHKPMIHDQFMNSASMRQRYWGRSMIGWRDFARAAPNVGNAQ